MIHPKTSTPVWAALFVAVLSACPASHSPCADIDCGLGTCVESGSAFRCDCQVDAAVDGGVCVHDDVCSPSPCAALSQSRCVVDAGQPACLCPLDMVDIGGSCVTKTACTPNPCVDVPHRSVCDVTDAGASCSCEPGYAPESAGCATTPAWTCDAQHRGPGEDSAEPDECPPLAGVLAADGGVERNLVPAGDHDWFLLRTALGHMYVLTAQVTSGTCGLLLEVFDAAGLVPVGADVRGVASAQVRFFNPLATQLTARVRAASTEICDYQLGLVDLGLDDFGEDPLTAATLSPGERFAGVVQYGGDRDIVRLALPAGLAVRLDARATAIGVVVDVLPSDGGTGRLLDRAQTVVSFPAAEVLTLVARGRQTTSLGAFVLQTTDLGPDDHSDERAFATPTQPSSAARPAQSERSDDVDAVSVVAELDHFYATECLVPASGAHCAIDVRSSSGQALGTGFGSLVWQATSAGTTTIGFSGAPGSLPVNYTYRVEDLGPDDFPSPPGGAQVAPGVVVNGRLETQADADAFVFDGVAGHSVYVTLTAPPGEAALELQTRTGTTLVSGGQTALQLLSTTDTYRVVVRPGLQWWSFVRYAVLITDLGPDDHGNSLATATPLTLGQSETGVAQFAGDEDWFTFTATANHLYRATCTPDIGTCALSVRDAQGSVLQTNFAGSLVFCPAQDGVVSVAVTPGAPPSAFTLRVEDLGLEDHGPTVATATLYPALGTALAGEFGFAGDVDVFRFDATAGHIYEVQCAAPAGRSCAPAILNPTGQVLVPVSAALNGGTRTRAFAELDGPLFVQLGPVNGTWAYALTIQDVGLDDYGNSEATATTIAGGTTISGELQYWNDLDVLVLPASPQHVYRVDFSSSVPSCSVTLLDGAAWLGATSGFMSNLEVRLPGSALVVQVSSCVATWSLVVTDEGLDDHGDTPATATPVTLGAPTPGTLQFDGDVDAFSVTAAAGDIFHFTWSGLSLPSARLAIWRPEGTQLVQSSTQASTVELGFRATTPGLYSATVAALMPGATGTYELRVDASTDDHGDTAATATPFAVDDTITGTIDYGGDVDVFSVPLTAGTTYTLTEQGARLRVWDPSGTDIGGLTTGGSATITAPVSGTYAIVMSAPSSSFARYTFTLQ